MKKITLSFATLSIAVMSYGQTQCTSLTKDSVRCKNNTKSISAKCHLHDPNYALLVNKTTTKVCSGTTKKGKNCKSKTKHESGLCHHHRPKSNK